MDIDPSEYVVLRSSWYFKDIMEINRIQLAVRGQTREGVKSVTKWESNFQSLKIFECAPRRIEPLITLFLAAGGEIPVGKKTSHSFLK